LSSPTHFTFLVLVVLNLVSGFQALGTLMAVGIMLLPAIAARFWADDVSGLILAAILSAFAASLSGLLLSYYANVPTGPAIILLAGVFYLLSVLLGVKGGLIWGLLPRKHLERDLSAVESSVMKHRIVASIALVLLALLGFAGGARAADKVKAVASFSILGDMVKQVGGDRIDVITLVGPDGDAHVYEPTPADAKNLATAQILFTNGLGFEGWMDRLEKSSGFRGKVMVASTGVKPRTMVEDEKTVTDPHAWQSLANGKLYVANIRDGLIAVDPEGKSVYEANAAKYLDALAKEEADVRAALAALPQERRKIITSHDAFGYFGAAYGLEIVAPEGVSTESEASAKDVAKIIRQIKAERIPAVFMENITDHRLLDQIASETGAKIGGELYTDALSPPDGPAPTYLDMFRHNVGALTAAVSA
jgi:zinc/manganese transport system substrate-binding protein